MNTWSENEYIALRQEITERVKVLHLLINTGGALTFGVAATSILMIGLNFNHQLIDTFMLLTPIIFALLTFNYQANQMTLETVARYVNTELKQKASVKSDWDDYYTKFKKGVVLTSFLKVLPLLWPMLIPVYYAFYFVNLSYIAKEIFVLDIFSVLIVLFNFKYKLRV